MPLTTHHLYCSICGQICMINMIQVVYIVTLISIFKFGTFKFSQNVIKLPCNRLSELDFFCSRYIQDGFVYI